MQQKHISTLWARNFSVYGDDFTSGYVITSEYTKNDELYIALRLRSNGNLAVTALGTNDGVYIRGVYAVCSTDLEKLCKVLTWLMV